MVTVYPLFTPPTVQVGLSSKFGEEAGVKSVIDEGGAGFLEQLANMVEHVEVRPPSLVDFA